jgi:uncharacterized protein (DUF2147 family)
MRELLMKNGGVYYFAGLSFLALMLSSFPTLAAEEDGVTGKWVRDDGGVWIEIAACGHDLCATNTWVKDPDGQEKVGDELILSVKPASSSVLTGQAYDVRRRRRYEISITVQQTSMSVSGCVFFGLICKNAEWTRSN